MWIKNYSAADVAAGSHEDPGDNSVLIQIADDTSLFPLPLFPFKKVYQFVFGDLEDKDAAPEEHKFSDLQAEQIIAILNDAITNHSNVIVHCVVGVCRSGAVVEVGQLMGFEESHRWRAPNLRVKHKLMKVLNFYSYDE